MGERTVWFSLSEKSSNKWKERFKYLCYFNTGMQDRPKFGLFQNHSFQKERPNYFQIIWNKLFHNQIFNFDGIIFVLLMQVRGFPCGLEGKLKETEVISLEFNQGTMVRKQK